jgi:tetratricopeptide (TPR) repeat protein
MFALAPGVLTPISATLGSSTPLDAGFRQMYDLEFSDAHKTFQTYIKMRPEDPMGSTSDGAAYLFAEFDRLGVLQTQLFLDDAGFKRRKKPLPDPTVRAKFDGDLAQSQELANVILRHSPNDRNALFATVLNLGLQSDYLCMVENRDLASLAYVKRAGVQAQKLLAIDPTRYDAYLAVGIENYILGLNPAPVRWLLRIYGAQTDKETGIQKLQLTAAKGHYLLPFARLLLAVAALRDHNRQEARELLQNLAEAFPNNRLYSMELARLQ